MEWATQHLREHYSRQYQYEKHDSPPASRVSMIRRMWDLMRTADKLPNRRILNIGSGPQSLERELVIDSYHIITLDIAEIMTFLHEVGFENIVVTKNSDNCDTWWEVTASKTS